MSVIQKLRTVYYQLDNYQLKEQKFDGNASGFMNIGYEPEMLKQFIMNAIIDYAEMLEKMENLKDKDDY